MVYIDAAERAPGVSVADRGIMSSIAESLVCAHNAGVVGRKLALLCASTRKKEKEALNFWF